MQFSVLEINIWAAWFKMETEAIQKAHGNTTANTNRRRR